VKAITQTEKYNEYDRIMEACINNIIIKANKEHHNIIYIDNFNINNINDLLYFEMCKIINLLYRYPIYMEIGIIDYFKLKNKNRKNKLKIKRTKKVLKSNREDMMNLVRNHFNKSEIIYKKIYEAFYDYRKED